MANLVNSCHLCNKYINFVANNNERQRFLHIYPLFIVRLMHRDEETVHNPMGLFP